MPEAKEPLARRLPEVRAYVDSLFELGWTPQQVSEHLQRLVFSSREREQRGLGHLPPDQLNIPYPTLAERYRWWKRQHPEMQRGEAVWTWWEEPDPDTARAVLQAVAWWESETGIAWGPISHRLAAKVAFLSRLAPDFPRHALLTLADTVVRAEALPEPERTACLKAIGRFLGLQVWKDLDGLVRYGIWTIAGRTPYVHLNGLGAVELLRPESEVWWRELAHDLGPHLPPDLVEHLVGDRHQSGQ